MYLSYHQVDINQLDSITDAHQIIFDSIYDAIWLTHRGRVTHIYISKIIIIGSDNGSLSDHAKPLSEPMLEYCYLDPWE